MEDDGLPGRESMRVSSPVQAAEVGDNAAGQIDETWVLVEESQRVKAMSRGKYCGK